MKELRDLVTQARMGDHHAYETIVRRFQDMAVGYGYTLLGDMDLAEDVAQEAFINAFYHLPDLRAPAAFPGWFRRIVSTQVHRLKRRNEVATIPLDKAPVLASHGQLGADPAEVAVGRTAHRRKNFHAPRGPVPAGGLVRCDRTRPSPGRHA